MKNKKILDTISKTLLVVGGLNWGLYAINSGWNLVAMIPAVWAEKTVYGIIAAAAIWLTYSSFKGK